MAQNPGRGKMAQESSGKQCLIHIPKKTGDLQKSTAYTATKIREFCRQWIDLDGNQQVIASRIASTQSISISITDLLHKERRQKLHN